ncbi:hypothetical protein STAS_30659 [Striga asiatica]|uniref:Uncharacterized protein n=1 Tax=Striga asiatica TaxID=4170 RepID=A0A5A7R6Z2_STRAF|nr:hypothetical protein STAS_30659 [Striga asiatica]
MQAGPLIPLSPSFSTYSDPNLAGIAARVVGELDSGELHDDYYSNKRDNPAHADQQGEDISDNCNADTDSGDPEEYIDFDFAFVNRESEPSSPIPADEIFQNGKIRPVYPVFDTDLLIRRQGKSRSEAEIGDGDRNSGSGSGRYRVRHPLRDLFIEERGTTIRTASSSSSSSEADEPTATDSYCDWQPGAAAEGGLGKKSVSAGGNSKRWRFKVKDLVRRSQSDGSKSSIVVLTDETKAVRETPAGGGEVIPAPRPPYNRDAGEKRRSYLPYRQDLVGFFGNVNGLRKNLKRS